MKKYFAFVALLIIIVLTFTSKKDKRYSNASIHPLFEVQCQNRSIPNFTLDYNANPSKEEVKKLCACIWDKLVGWEKETSIQLTSGNKDKISAIHMAGFPAIFGKRISDCGGENL